MLVFMFISLATKSSNLTGHPSSPSEHIHLISFPLPAHLTQYSTPPTCSNNSIMKKKKIPLCSWEGPFSYEENSLDTQHFPEQSLYFLALVYLRSLFSMQISQAENVFPPALHKWDYLEVVCFLLLIAPFRILSLSLNQTCYFEAPTTRFHATPMAIPLMSMHFPNAYFPSFIEDLATDSRSSFPIYFCYNSWKYQISFMKLI